MRRLVIAVLTVAALVAAPNLPAGAGEKPRKPPKCRRAPEEPGSLPTAPTTSTTVPCLARAKLTKKKASRGEWTGVFNVISTQNVPGNSCGSEWDGELEFKVRENGTIYAGTASADATRAPYCTVGFVGVPGATHAEFTVEGGFDGSAFSLRFIATSIDGYEAGFHILYHPRPITIRVPLFRKDLGDATFAYFWDGPEEGEGGTASIAGIIVVSRPD